MVVPQPSKLMVRVRFPLAAGNNLKKDGNYKINRLFFIKGV